MYRPTVRYDNCFKEYVEELFNATDLDRNQIIRLGLFLLGHTNEGREILSKHLRTTSLPYPNFSVTDNGLWYGFNKKYPFEGGTSHVDKDSLEGQQREVTQQSREIHQDTEPTKTHDVRREIIFRFNGNTILLPR